MTLSKKKIIIIFILLFILNVFFRFAFISVPDATVFDEVHFVKFAAQYARGEMMFDIHPPLGKFLFAIPLFFFPEDSYDPEFLYFNLNEYLPDKIVLLDARPFGSFPYTYLRFISAFFGTLLSFAVFLFARTLTQNNTVAVIALFLVTFENALITHSRFILIDSMYLAMGTLALALFYSRKTRWGIILSGFVWGMALSVKLIAVIFLGPILAGLALEKHRSKFGKKVLLFFFTGIITLFIVILVLPGTFIPLNERIDFYSTELGLEEASYSTQSIQQKMGAYLSLAFIDIYYMVSGNVAEVYNHPSQSYWYTWPFMHEGIPLFIDTQSSYILVGNPIIWAFVLIGFVVSTFLLFRLFLKKGIGALRTDPPLFILTFSYVFALMPFFTFVKRGAFLYHYYPALLFGIVLAAYLFVHYLNKKKNPLRNRIGLICIILVLLGFIFAAPWTYGISLL